MMDRRRRQWGVVCSVLVLSVLLAVASSQSPSPKRSPSPGAAAPKASSRPVAPSPARRVPSFPPGASPAPKRASRPAAAPAPRPRPRPRPASPSPPAASPRPKPPSQPAVSPAPRPRSPSGSAAAPVPARKPSSPPAASPVPKLPTPPTASPVPKPAPATPTQKPSPSPAPKPSPPTTPPPAPKPSAPVTVTPPPPQPPTPAPSPPTTPPPAPKQSAPLTPPPSSPPAPAPAPANSSPPASSLAQLSPSFYALSCPSVELAVSDVVRSASTLDPTIPGKLLRMVFHDCFVEGCDASVLIAAGNGTERTDPANLSLGGFNVIDEAKRLLEAVCPATVSCSDIVVLAARDAVTFTGGPSVPVSLGRRDSLVSLATNVRANIIDTGFSVDAMAASFASKGLTLDDLVTLSGGHTIGSAHCGTFRERFRPDANGSMVPVDGSMNTEYANQLIRACSAGTATVDCDEGSASAFDNRYYGNLLDGRGLLRTDAVLVQNATTRAKVAAFAQSQDSFFRSWADSFARLTALGVKTGADGEIRRFCSSVNG